MELKIHNDGKEKWQSFEVWIDEIDCERGYGGTEEEAMESFRKILYEYLTKVNWAYGTTRDGSIAKVQVDWRGNKLQGEAS